MTRIIRSSEAVAGGYIVTIEVTNAYTNGESRFDRVFVERSAMVGKAKAQRRQAVFEALDDDPVGDIAGEAVVEPTATKEIFEARSIAKYEAWQRWKTTRVEAQARSAPAPVVTALQNREDAVWAEYLALLQAWRAAP